MMCDGKKGYLIKRCSLIKQLNEIKKRQEIEVSKPDEQYNKQLTKYKWIITNTVDKTSLIYEANDDNIWIIDSGATKHTTSRRDWLVDFRQSDIQFVRSANGTLSKVEGIGKIKAKVLGYGQWNKVVLHDVLYVPDIKRHLFSVSSFANNCEFTFTRENVIAMKGDKWIIYGGKSDNLYIMLMQVRSQLGTDIQEVNTHYFINSLQRWHERLGHVNVDVLRQMIKNDIVKGIKLNDTKDFACEACHLDKSIWLLDTTAARREIYKPGEFIHLNVYGPMSTVSIDGSRFFVTFVDEASGFRTVYFLRHKSDVFKKFKEFRKSVVNRFGALKVLHVGIDCTQQLIQYVKAKGIKLEISFLYGPCEQDRNAKSQNHTIVEIAKTMITTKNLPMYLWAQAVNTAVYVLNRISPKKTPYEIWCGKKPDISHLKIFGTTAFINLPKRYIFRKKFQPKKGQRVLMVGYQDSKIFQSTCYRVFDPERKVITIEKNVSFNEQCGMVSTFVQKYKEEDFIELETSNSETDKEVNQDNDVNKGFEEQKEGTIKNNLS